MLYRHSRDYGRFYLIPCCIKCGRTCRNSRGGGGQNIVGGFGLYLALKFSDFLISLFLGVVCDHYLVASQPKPLFQSFGATFADLAAKPPRGYSSGHH